VFFYDEIQQVPGWERWVRYLATKSNHKVFVTGSNSEMLSSELASTLTGRHTPLHLTPLSYQEIASYWGVAKDASSQSKVERFKVINQLLTIGGFPRPFLDNETSLLPIYFSDIINRDIIRRRKVRHGSALIRLGDLLCRENTRLFNRTKTAKLLGIKDLMTIDKYCEYFKECYLFYELRNYSLSLRKKLRSLSKFYCVDPALPATVAGSPSAGQSACFENLVFLELLRLFPQASFSYWHSPQKREVDFIVEQQGELVAIQVAQFIYNEQTLVREVEGLKEASQELGTGKLFLVTLEQECLSQAILDQIKQAGISLVPIWKIKEIDS